MNENTMEIEYKNRPPMVKKQITLSIETDVTDKQLRNNQVDLYVLLDALVGVKHPAKVIDVSDGTKESLTSRGQTQDGLTFTCNTHGTQGFECMSWALPEYTGIQLACRCFWRANSDGSLTKRKV